MEALKDDLARKARGAFFTPPLIADFLASWAIGGKSDARILDPTCGEAVFLLAAAARLRSLKVRGDLGGQLFGVDLHENSLDVAADLLRAEHSASATLLAKDFSALDTPDHLGHELPLMDAVIGNPPFIRYQEHRGDVRKRAAAAALAQGVRLSGLASSWAPLLVHASGFLKEDGRLAMVLPAELLTVNYAEPVRRWLQQRFAAVRLVFFERLQFNGAEEQVVLLAAEGSGGCKSFTLVHVNDAEDLAGLHVLDPLGAEPASQGKWTDLLLTMSQRQAFQRVSSEHFSALADYGSPELGTVTGANSFFTLSDPTRKKFRIPERYLKPISPPGTKHLTRTTFTKGQWEELRCTGHRVWLLHPETANPSRLPSSIRSYVEHGEELGVDSGYKCAIRPVWWIPPAVSPPDLFFTYMSHRFPRLISNLAGVGFVNSMHGVRLQGAPTSAKKALPLLSMNSVTLLGAEVYGRSYGGGVLKMEPREAASLPVPNPDALEKAWTLIGPKRTSLDRAIARGCWRDVQEAVDTALLKEGLGMSQVEVTGLREAGEALRLRRTRRAE